MSTRNPDFAPPIDADIHDARRYEEERAEHLRKRYGPDTVWDPAFGGLDDRDRKAKQSSQELRNEIAKAGLDGSRPMRFSVRIANRDIALQLAEQDGVWFTNLPIEVEPNRWEWRRLEARGYDDLLAAITRNLRAGPAIRDLTPEEELELARMCVSKKKGDLAVVLERYLQMRLGRGADETTLNDPRYLSVVNQSVLFIFKHSEPAYTPEADAYIKRFAADKPLNLPLVRVAFAAYQKERQKAEAEKPPHVSESQLQESSDRELSETFRAVRKAYGDADRQRRDLLHRTPEQAIEDLRGPE